MKAETAARDGRRRPCALGVGSVSTKQSSKALRPSARIAALALCEHAPKIAALPFFSNGMSVYRSFSVLPSLKRDVVNFLDQTRPVPSFAIHWGLPSDLGR